MTIEHKTTVEEDALEVLDLERKWMDYDGGDDEKDESLRYDFIEAASALATRVSGYGYEWNQKTGKMEKVKL